jgi:dTDP-4-dehydrorhamnose reductase
VDLLVIGGSGFLGRTITRQAALAGHRYLPCERACGRGVDWRTVDIRRDDVAALSRQVRPGLMVNAAYRQSDWETTADGAAHVALAAAGAEGVRLLHVSTDALFSGTAL